MAAAVAPIDVLPDPVRSRARAGRAGAMAGIAYAVLVAIENLDVLGAPSYDSSTAEVLAAYRAPAALLAITTIAGIAALVAYFGAAVTIWSVVGRDGTAAPFVLAAAAAGPVLGAVGLALHGTLVVGVDNGLTADAAALLYDLRLAVQALGALPIGVYALVVSLAGGHLPRALAWTGAPIGAGAALASTMVVVGTDAARAVLLTALAGTTVWLLAVSVWLLFASWEPSRFDSPWVATGRVLAGTVAVAAGTSGLALLAFPGSTAGFFSWHLAPAPLASLIGAFYVASAVVYGRAATAPWPELRVMVAGIVPLSVPILVATLAHLEVFDFGRLAVWVWVILFAAFPVVATAVLIGAPGGRRDAERRRVGATIVAVALAVVSVALWIAPACGAGILPFDPAPLSGRVLGGWTLLLAFLALSSKRRVPALALVCFPIAAVVAMARSFSDLTM